MMIETKKIDFVKVYSDLAREVQDNYSGSTIIEDAISEVANSNVDVYYYDLLEWAKNHISDANRSVEDGLCCDTSDLDVFKILEGSQFICNEEEINEELTSIIINIAIKYLKENYKEIDTDDFSELVSHIDDCVSFCTVERFSDVYDEVDEFMSNKYDRN